MTASLDARLVVRRPGFALELALAVAAGEVVALLGPNGAGKSTALRAVAGLQQLHDGHLRVAGRTWEEPVRGIRLPAEKRRAGLVFQDYRLFPHLSVRENVAFGPRSRGRSRREARAIADGLLERVGLTGLAARRPGQLSGGQAQRVALARALAVAPQVLLLDEPLAALDAGTRAEVRTGLRDHLAGQAAATLLVTHDPLDAMVLADRLVVIERGRVTQQGSPAEIAVRPRTAYVARLMGLNLLRGRVADGRLWLPGGGGIALTGTPESGSASSGGAVPGDVSSGGGVPAACGGEVLVAFRPAAVRLHVGDAPADRSSGGAAGSGTSALDGSRSGWSAVVEGVESHGDYLRVRLGGPIPALADVLPAEAAGLDLRSGRRLHAALDAGQLRVYPADGPDTATVTGPPADAVREGLTAPAS